MLTAITLKNRLTPPFQQAQVSLHYETGLDPYAGLFEFMLDEAGLISKAKKENKDGTEGKEGNTYVIVETQEKLGVGEANAAKKIKDHPELLQKLEEWLSANKRYSQIQEIKDAYEQEKEQVEVTEPVKDVRGKKLAKSKRKK
jgi:hypothetical protein